MTEKQYPSQQYLNEILSNTEFASAAPIEVVRCMAKELLKYRKSETVAYLFEGSDIESPQLGFPHELDEEQMANCVQLIPR